ncbi:unnamed protein product [Bursaphelenchus okinawaensis]|uniref:Uncharacterized protein n=1 Tax=Bursaphelenchus okinawaensis TaxID=465554 RepID=A0A811KUV2_9BILA|nr:unnamed protein product [Bursaphelenchus okinawaensis]CAG9112460.1 unnamed protein product [Bursaphelenchus okinawaensis]
MAAKKCKKCHRKIKQVPNWALELHGLSQYFLSDRYEKRMWIVIIGICFVFAGVFTNILIREYMERRTSTVFEYHQLNKIRYPGVTICPNNGDAIHYRDLEIDMRSRMENITNAEVDDLIIFALAGSGVDGFQTKVSLWDPDDIQKLTLMIETWRGDRSWKQFFEFVFDRNGYTCEELFYKCFYGQQTINCCEIFQPVYVILVGRCFQLQEYYQTAPNDWGRLHIYMNELPSYFLSASGKQNHMILYLSDNYSDVARYPKVPLGPQILNKIGLQMRTVAMSEADQHCSNSEESKGRGTCFANRWLTHQLIEPLNCTVHYLDHKTNEYTVCHPTVIITNYKNVTTNHVDTKSCRPACNREILTEQLQTGKVAGYSSAKADYSVVISYSDMQVEAYRENVRITLAGFVSEIGGQFMLFLGLSLNTVIQMSLLIGNFIRKLVTRQCNLVV